jgi:hypothetical protein
MACSKSLKKRNSVSIKRKYKTKTRKYLKKTQTGGSSNVFIYKNGQIQMADNYISQALTDKMNNDFPDEHEYDRNGNPFYILKKYNYNRIVNAHNNNNMKIIPDLYTFISPEDYRHYNISTNRESLQEYLGLE